MKLIEDFSRFSRVAATALGSPGMFVGNCLLILLWLGFGPVFHFSNTWQLLVNTVTTVATYLAVFLIQNTQNRDAKAMHLKLDELISSLEGARNRFVNLEELTEAELDRLRREFEKLARRAETDHAESTRAIPGSPD